MKRRDFMVFACTAACAPLHATAQDKSPRVAFLMLANPEPYWTFFRDAFREAGYVDGRNIQLDFRSAEGSPELLARHVENLAHANVDLIMCVATPVVKAMMQATRQIPVVFLAGNPLETGIVKSLSRPGGNATGLSLANLELTAKTLELMREILPSLRRVGGLINADDLAFGKPMLDQVITAATPLNLEVHQAIVHARELEPAFQAMVKSKVQAAVVQPTLPRPRVIELAFKYRLPIVCSNAAWAPAGALMSYAPDLRDVCRQAVDYASRILKGAKPADLPIQQPTKFNLIINQKTARSVGLSVPQSLLVRADEVIE
jgi:putative tryptophan/tyrosine transport system substrate-binding protein